MDHLILRSDLEPWTCDECKKDIFRGCSFNRHFYCLDCIDVVRDGFQDSDEIGKNDELEELSF